MFFKSYNVYENKLSEKLNDDNPYKKKLIEMETPAEKHPIYTGLVWGLLIYSWIFFMVLSYHQIRYTTIMAELNLWGTVLNMIFITGSIMICYKKGYLIGINPAYRRNSYIIFAIVLFFSILFTIKPSGSEMSGEEILKTFCFFCDINDKSYLALNITSYCSLGIAISYYSCPYEIYRTFYSVHQTYHEYKSEKILINKSMIFLFLCLLVIVPCIYQIFNPVKDSFEMRLRNLSLFFVCGSFYFCTSIFVGNLYYRNYEKAIRFDKENNK